MSKSRADDFVSSEVPVREGMHSLIHLTPVNCLPREGSTPLWLSALESPRCEVSLLCHSTVFSKLSVPVLLPLQNRNNNSSLPISVGKL